MEENMSTSSISTYTPSIGVTAVSIGKSSSGKIYDYFQSLGGKDFLFMGKGGYLEFVPVKEAGNPLTRYWRQLTLLFKESVITPSYGDAKKENFSAVEPQDTKPQDTTGGATDFFCQDRAKAQVIWKGKMIKILYPDNPTVKHHFLFVTKEHRDSFKDITKEEFLEVIDLAKRVGDIFEGKSFILCKTGFDAGQTVPHFHLHLMIMQSKSEGFFARLKIFANIVFHTIPFFSTRLRGQELLDKVEVYKEKLECLSS